VLSTGCVDPKKKKQVKKERSKPSAAAASAAAPSSTGAALAQDIAGERKYTPDDGLPAPEFNEEVRLSFALA
jgi:hypothetical protein